MKGDPRCGRPRGISNKRTIEVRAWARSILEDEKVRARTLALARSGKLAPAILTELYNRAYGKVTDTLEVTRPRPLVVEFITDAEAHVDGSEAG